jgi:hypothetical protein
LDCPSAALASAGLLFRFRPPSRAEDSRCSNEPLHLSSPFGLMAFATIGPRPNTAARINRINNAFKKNSVIRHPRLPTIAPDWPLNQRVYFKILDVPRCGWGFRVLDFKQLRCPSGPIRIVPPPSPLRVDHRHLSASRLLELHCCARHPGAFKDTGEDTTWEGAWRLVWANAKLVLPPAIPPEDYVA